MSGTIIPKWQWTAYGIQEPIAEFRFHQERRWRIDYAWPQHMLAVEIEGGVWTKGRHVRGKGFIIDMEKYNSLAELGWRLLRYQPGKVDFKQIKALLTKENTKC